MYHGKVSDGSVQRGEACHAWKIVTEGREAECASAAGPCDADPDKVNSYRAELSGILGGIAFAIILLRHHDLTVKEGTDIAVYCDNLSAVNKIAEKTILVGVKHHSIPEYDLIDCIFQLLKTHNFPVDPRHVKGHAVGR
mmetsp:Transcript_12944/g.27953  ORF Transcript_12944/g.27953 Transcript_12944/m.27953 type:complete len:139 (+) Transcript_12944:84-500(+)